MNEFLRILICTAPFVFLVILNTKINLNRTNRAYQFPMPVFTLLYVIIGAVGLERISVAVESFLTDLGSYFPAVHNVPWDSYMIFILNSLFVVVFILLKAVLMPVLSGFWKKSKKLCEKTSGYFYEFDDDTGIWMFMKHFANFRTFYKGLFYAFFLLSVVLFILSQFFREVMIFKAAFYPVFGILLFGEVVYYLDGVTKTEFVEDILGEDEDAYRIANYGLLRGILGDLFGDRVLHESTYDTGTGLSTDFDALEDMEKSDDRTLKTLGGYFKELKSAGKDIDINYVKSCVNILSGKSTLFSNPFYRDLTDYIMLPVIKQMISYKKCLIITGRDSLADDVKDWMDEAMLDFNSTSSLWKTKILDKNTCQDDIGILKGSDIYDLEVHRANSEFLEKVGLVLIIEPSKLLATGQIGLSLIVNRCEKEGKSLVYLACDRNCDGLVDALSHVLRTSITEVTATLSGGANCSHMLWEADGDYMHHKLFSNVSRYLGVGTELSAVGMKYQIAETTWLGSEKFPVTDMKWIAGQYYRQICNYADIPQSQSEFNRVFNVSSNMWNYPVKENAYMVVEDEFNNLFEMTRVYSSRAKNQCFINVISDNYYLRDYMIDNVGTFSSDPKAIPTIVPDYARTERNTVLRLIMMMTGGAVSESIVEKELTLCSISYDDPYQKLRELIVKHCNVDNPTLSVNFKEEFKGQGLESAVVKQYEITETNSLYEYSRLLKNAYCIAEDEEGEKHYIAAKLYGHVFQAFLPGQFITFDGKYYEIKSITPQNGIVVRRAADHITHRRYYKQLRNVTLSDFVVSEEIGSVRTEYDLEITRGFASIAVSTEGYYEMQRSGDIKNAKKVTINGIPERLYKNKSVLKIRLTGAQAKVRYTVCLLLNEIFKTVYPEGYPYICALTLNDCGEEKAHRQLMYGFSGDIDEDCIYIIEDSDIDLGLIVSVERNLGRFFEMITETLTWHTEKMRETPQEEEAEIEFKPEFNELGAQKKTVGEKIKGFFGRLFGRKSKEEETEAEIKSEPVEFPDPFKGGGTVQENAPLQKENTEETEEITFVSDDINAGISDDLSDDRFSEEASSDGEEAGAELPDIEIPVMTQDHAEESQTEAYNSSENSESDNSQVLQSKITRPFVLRDEDAVQQNEPVTEAYKEETEYQKHCFLKFGYDVFPELLDAEGTIEYLSGYGFNNNPLQQVRTGEGLAEEYEKTYDPKKYGAHLCDFCGIELIGGEYEVLADGRERCNRCSMSAVKTGDDFKELFKTVLRNMEAFYGIKLNVAIKVRMTDAGKIAKHFGEKFVATPGFDGRTLGFAQKDKTGYSIYIENGSPKLAAAATIAHELTHIWQYLNWDEKAIRDTYGKNNTLEVYEGMAKWAEIQYLILLNEIPYAKRQEITTKLRDDAYGQGFIKYSQKYPLSYTTKAPSHTPFKENPPL